jgi:hypothetical protein
VGARGTARVNTRREKLVDVQLVEGRQAEAAGGSANGSASSARAPSKWADFWNEALSMPLSDWASSRRPTKRPGELYCSLLYYMIK